MAMSKEDWFLLKFLLILYIGGPITVALIAWLFIYVMGILV